ncbi:MAG: GntR family transcriptional regulator [Gammaproteobacteria bacterium]|nr:GntR family transcriptional regulator [Gammaproteobacteria bacterium]
MPSGRELASRFEVSRPTIYETIIAWEITGLITIKTGSGIYILAKTSTQAPRTLGEVPCLFEESEAQLHIGDLAAARLSKVQLRSIEQARLQF